MVRWCSAEKSGEESDILHEAGGNLRNTGTHEVGLRAKNSESLYSICEQGF